MSAPQRFWPVAEAPAPAADPAFEVSARSTRNRWYVQVNAQTEVGIAKSRGPGKPRVSADEAAAIAVRFYAARKGN